MLEEVLKRFPEWDADLDNAKFMYHADKRGLLVASRRHALNEEGHASGSVHGASSTRSRLFRFELIRQRPSSPLRYVS